jgi:hypothetical protein
MSLAADPQQRIEAIKAYREQTGAGLKEAVAVIDKVAASAKGVGAYNRLERFAVLIPESGRWRQAEEGRGR